MGRRHPPLLGLTAAPACLQMADMLFAAYSNKQMCGAVKGLEPYNPEPKAL